MNPLHFSDVFNVAIFMLKHTDPHTSHHVHIPLASLYPPTKACHCSDSHFKRSKAGKG